MCFVRIKLSKFGIDYMYKKIKESEFEFWIKANQQNVATVGMYAALPERRTTELNNISQNLPVLAVLPQTLTSCRSVQLFYPD